MADPKPQQEPSIEEILESIRQIISEDGEAAPAPTTLAAPAPAPAQPAATLKAPPAPPPLPAYTAAMTQDADDDILDLTEKAVPAAPVVIDMTDSEPPAPPRRESAPRNDETLLSDMSADISAHAMARLLAGNVAVERDLPGRAGNVTLEDMTRELLRPLLKSWLDQNLPPLIERMVAREIEKISRMAMKQ